MGSLFSLPAGSFFEELPFAGFVNFRWAGYNNSDFSCLPPVGCARVPSKSFVDFWHHQAKEPLAGPKSAQSRPENLPTERFVIQKAKTPGSFANSPRGGWTSGINDPFVGANLRSQQNGIFVASVFQ